MHLKISIYSTFLSSVRVELLNVRFAKLKQSGFMGANFSVLNNSGWVCGIWRDSMRTLYRSLLDDGTYSACSHRCSPKNWLRSVDSTLTAVA